MEEGRGEKYVCRLCNKGFSNGRILGGHMRGHMGAKLKSIAREEDEATKQTTSNWSVQEYRLRENPKKSWKNSGTEFECDKCGKQFESPKALFGHMRHHSRKEKEGAECAECGRGFRNLRGLRTHMRSHSVKFVGDFEDSGGNSIQVLAFESLTVKRKRSRTIRYRITPSSSVSGLNESFSVSQTEEEEEEEVALCLLMLASGVRDFDGCNESEIKSLHQNEQFSENVFGDDSFSGEDFDDDDDEYFKMKKPREEISNSAIVVSSGVLCEEGFPDEAIEVRPIKVKLIEGFGSMKSSPCKDYNFTVSADVQKENLYSCKTCNKTFNSHQALGGHQTIHRSSHKSLIKSKTDNFMEKFHAFSNKTDVSVEKIQAFSENSTETESGSKFRKLGFTELLAECSNGGSRDIKPHQCEICLKTFESGQALGGHKRAHLKEKQQEMNQEFSDTELDLNLPAMFTEAADTDLHYRSFWVRNDSSNHEPMIGLVAN